MSRDVSVEYCELFNTSRPIRLQHQYYITALISLNEQWLYILLEQVRVQKNKPKNNALLFTMPLVTLSNPPHDFFGSNARTAVVLMLLDAVYFLVELILVAQQSQQHAQLCLLLFTFSVVPLVAQMFQSENELFLSLFFLWTTQVHFLNSFFTKKQLASVKTEEACACGTDLRMHNGRNVWSVQFLWE